MYNIVFFNYLLIKGLKDFSFGFTQNTGIRLTIAFFLYLIRILDLTLMF